MTWTLPAERQMRRAWQSPTTAPAHPTCSLVDIVVDQTAPTAILASPAANVRGTITVHATGVADATSGVNSVTFERTPDGSSSWALVGNGVAQGGGADDASFDTTSVADGLYDYRVTVTISPATSTQKIVGPVRVEPRPADRLDRRGRDVRPRNDVLTSNSADAGSGSATTGYEISPHGAGTWTSVPTFDTTTKADGDYDLRAVVTDAVGNVGHCGLDHDEDRQHASDGHARPGPHNRRAGLAEPQLDDADSGSGLASSRLRLSPHLANCGSTTASPFDTCHGLRRHLRRSRRGCRQRRQRHELRPRSLSRSEKHASDGDLRRSDRRARSSTHDRPLLDRLRCDVRCRL